MALQLPSTSAENPWEEFQKEIESEYEQAQRSLSEVSLMLEQSQGELAKLSQRNAAITGHLQQVQAQLDTMPRQDIRVAYTAALEAQQRLLMMRGQLDKLQNDQETLKRYVGNLEKFRAFLALDAPRGKGSRGAGASANLEMVINAQAAERQRLSRQMHDGPAQALSNFIVQAEIANRLLDIDPKRAKEVCDVACTGCGICARNSQGAITMVDGLAVIDHAKLDPTIIPIEKCKTNAIGWLHPRPQPAVAEPPASAGDTT